ncbi:MAG: tetratricopeptide repeat protein [Elusimicrobiota bacterium]
MRSGDRRHLLALGALPFLVFFGALDSAFHLDDFFRVVGNPQVETLHPFWRHFFDPSTASSLSRISEYRPLLPLSLSLNFAVAGHNLLGYHLFNLAAHTATMILVYLLGAELLAQGGSPARPADRRLIALLAALTFGLHPVSGILVNYICSRDLIMATMFMMGSFLAYVRTREGGRSAAGYCLSAVLFVPALLSKKNALMLPALLLLYEALLGKDKVVSKSTLLRLLLFPLIAAAFWGFERHWLGFSSLHYLKGDAPLIDLGYLATQVKVHVSRYWINLVYPFRMNGDPLIAKETALWHPKPLLSLLLISATVVTAWRLRRRRPLWSFCIAAYWTLLAPTSSFLKLHRLAADYRPYASLIFLSLLIYAALDSLLSRSAVKKLAVLTIGYLSIASMIQNSWWRTERSLWEHGVETGGGSLAHLNLAMTVMDPEEDRAKALLERALEISPHYILAHINLGLLHLRRGEVEKGLRMVEHAVSLDPGRAQSHFWLSRALKAAGRGAEALREAKTAGDMDTKNAEYQYEAARALQDAGSFEESLIFLDRLHALLPNYKRSRFLHGFGLQKLGRRRAAISAYREALRFDPDYFRLHFNLAYALMRDGDCAGAAPHFRKTLALRPSYGEAADHLKRCSD